ncbi:maleylacetoacetate isomerase [Rhodoferax sp.]|uniref:maleylacetoacetate isomerase n=1 Tax=Rhodoferax sp. TaxID=50421 RepID=UPI00262D6362|nr:maleylacetoacetate isomerase [Rhodoferax sp.]MDD2808279.1 maleylacetoacetate isomerase [Rhodoferax sp.]MDD4944103.1 maleylacetoacetate isomerase [Rhodoferax sp.]
MKVYNYFRSGTSHRLRIVLNLKGLDWDYVAVDLRAEAHFDAAFKALNPQGFVPTLIDGDLVLTQSPAIIEWLEERYPTPPLLPVDVNDRARVRALAAVVGCDIHPLNNRRVLEYLRHTLACDDAAVMAWCGTWINAGFEALETLLAADPNRGNFCFGGQPGLADAYLVAQVESARRFKVDLTPYPFICAVDQACANLQAFVQAAPKNQPDAL